MIEKAENVKQKQFEDKHEQLKNEHERFDSTQNLVKGKQEHYKFKQKDFESKQNQYKSKQKRPGFKHNRGKNKHKLVSVADFEFRILHEEIMQDAKALQIPEGAAEEITKNVVREANRWLDMAGKATVGELREKILAELKKYHADLAYLYQNRGKII